MTIDPTSLPRLKQRGQSGALAIQDQNQNQDDKKELEEDFIIQIAKRVKEEWEIFHLEHSDIDEETFVQAQRFCVKQWFLQKGIILADLPAFERVEKHFACEVQQRVAEIEAIAEMLENPIYWETHSLAADIVAQAQERSKRACEAIKQLSSNQAPYLAGKIQQLRAPEQAQEREQEARQRRQEVEQQIEYLKALGITIEYENHKAKLMEREKVMQEQVNTLGRLLAENSHKIDAARYIASCEGILSHLDVLLEELHPRTLESHDGHNAVETGPNDQDAVTQRGMSAQKLAETWEEFILEIQAGSKDALSKAKAEIKPIGNVETALEHMRKRRVAIERWSESARQHAQERKKHLKEVRSIYIQMMIKAREDLFGEQARYAVRPATAEEPGSGYQRIHHRPLPSGDPARDTAAAIAADEAELESIYQQGKRRAQAPPDSTHPGTGAGLDAFRCAERFVQAKGVDRIIKTEEQVIYGIEQIRRKTKDAIEQLQNIYKNLNKIKMCYLSIAEKGVKLAKFLEKGKYALEQAVHAAESSAKEEMEAYTQVKRYTTDALRSLQAISAEYSQMEEPSMRVFKHFTDFLQDSLPFEHDILNRALSGVKHIVKASNTLLRAEEQAKEAAHQTAISIEAGADASTAQLTSHEQEALLLTALANDALAGYTACYLPFHAVATYVATEQLEAMLETSTEQFVTALQVIKEHLREMKQQKAKKDAQCQAATAGQAGSQAHLLIDERTGVITLKDGRATFHLQDLADIGEAPLQEQLGQSRLWFKDGHPSSSYDVAHNLLQEQCEARTRIHLQVPDGAGGRGAMLCLPNGTHIKVADIDLEQTEYDPVQPERGVTITLKKDGQKINLLAAASVMTTRLMPEALRELMSRSLDECIHRLASTVGTKDSAAIEEAFLDAKSNDRHRRYIEKYILSSQDGERRQKDLMEWMQSIQNVTGQSIEILHEYVEKVLNEEYGEKEITELTVLEQVAAGKMPDELFHKRRDCLYQIGKARGFETIIHCQLLRDPADSSAGTYLNPTVQEALMEYERAIAFQQAQQWQEESASGASDKWASYLARLRRAILDEAPAFFRTKLLIYHIREAVKADHWEQGTAENPGVAQLAQELQARPSAVGKQDRQGDNEYANALRGFVQQAVAGVQGALETGDPAEIISRIDLLDLAFNLLYHAETRIWQALNPTTPTALAKEIVEPISSAQGRATHDDGAAQQRASKQRQSHNRRPF